MTYRKFQADNIFDGYSILPSNQVLIAREDGEIVTIINEIEAGEDIEHLEGMLCPGFINTHCHVELSHLKNLISQKTGLVNFILAILQLRHQDESVILDAIEKAETEMIENGIAAVGDISNTAITLNQKAKGNLHYYNFIETSGFSPSIANERMQIAKNVYNQFTNAHLKAAIVPHAPYSVSNALFQLIKENYNGGILSMHNQETPTENAFFQTGISDFQQLYQALNINIDFFKPTNQTSLSSTWNNLPSSTNVLLVHNTFTTQQDIEKINKDIGTKHDAIFFCLCPNANLYIENKLPPINLLLNNNCNIVIGTDSLASNLQINILEELKTIKKNYPNIPTKQLLQWATINGAKALQMDGFLGSFEQRKKPRIILLKNLVHKEITLYSHQIPIL